MNKAQTERSAAMEQLAHGQNQLGIAPGTEFCSP